MNQIDSLWVVATDGRLSEVSSLVDSMQQQMNTLQMKNDILFSIIETSNSSVSNQLTIASVLLAIISFLLTIGGSVLGLYIRKKKREIVAIANTIEKNKQTVDDIAETTKQLDQQINNNITSLYARLRKEETNAFLDRLILEPRDISNLLHFLLARDLDEDGFSKLRKAYLKYKSSATEDEEVNEESESNGFISISLYGTYTDNYVLLFFQHYFCESLEDDEIRPEIIKRFGQVFDQAFKRDIIKSTIDMCRALSSETSSFNKEDVLFAFLKALSSSKHRGLSDVKNILEQNISPESLLRNVIERCRNEGVSLKLFLD